MNAFRKFSVLLLAVALITSVGAALAVEMPKETEEQVQEMQQLHEKWDALTDRQRNAVYKLFAQKGKAEIALMDEYATLGLISEDEAEEYAARVKNWLEALKESGKLPPVFGHTRRNGECKNCKSE